MTADPLCYIALMGVLFETDMDLDLDLDPMQHLSTKSDDNSRRAGLGQKPRIKPAVAV